MLNTSFNLAIFRNCEHEPGGKHESSAKAVKRQIVKLAHANLAGNKTREW